MSSDTQPNSVVDSSTSSTAIMNGISPKQKTSSSLNSQASASGAFSKLIEAVKECSKYEPAYRDIEGTQKLLVKRDSELKRAREELQKEKDNHTHLIIRQAEALKSWSTEKGILEMAKEELNKTLNDERKKMDSALKEERKKIEEICTENEKLKSELEEKKENIASLRKEWNDEKANSSRLKAELVRAKRANGDLDTELDTCKEELREWKSYGIVLHDVDVGDFSNKMHNLWTRFQKFAEKYFLVDLSENLLMEPDEWNDVIKSLQIIEGVPPLPPRNSVTAKQMRMTAALALIADRIDYHVFAPIYTGVANDGIRELLLEHAETDIKKEAVCRALVLSGYTEDDQRQAAEKLVLSVTKNVSSLLSRLLSPSLIDSFPTELETLIHEAMTLWWFAQRSPFKIEASVDDVEGWEWNNLNIFDNPAGSPTSGGFQIALFPRIVIVREDGWHLVFPGAALWESQTAAAGEEWNECKAAMRPTSFRGQGRHGGAFRGPTSPTNTSFLDRRKSGAGRGNG